MTVPPVILERKDDGDRPVAVVNRKAPRMRTRNLLAGLTTVALAVSLVTGIAPSAGAGTARPGVGIVGWAFSTTQVTGITGSEVELTDLSDQFGVSDPGGFSRWTQVTASLRMRTETAPASADVYLDVTDLNTSPQQTTRIGGASIWLPMTSSAGATTLFVRGLASLRTSTYVVKVKVRRTSGTGTITASYTLGGPQTLLIEDLGF